MSVCLIGSIAGCIIAMCLGTSVVLFDNPKYFLHVNHAALHALRYHQSILMVMNSAILLKMFLAICLLYTNTANANNKPSKSYPEHGTVIAVRIDQIPQTAWQVHRYRVETETKFYEFRDWNYGEGASLELNEMIEFRIERDRLYVKRNNMDRRYHFLGFEQKLAPPSANLIQPFVLNSTT